MEGALSVATGNTTLIIYFQVVFPVVGSGGRWSPAACTLSLTTSRHDCKFPRMLIQEGPVSPTIPTLKSATYNHEELPKLSRCARRQSGEFELNQSAQVGESLLGRSCAIHGWSDTRHFSHQQSCNRCGSWRRCRWPRQLQRFIRFVRYDLNTATTEA